jgi:hypothetical protein
MITITKISLLSLGKSKELSFLNGRSKRRQSWADLGIILYFSSRNILYFLFYDQKFNDK